MATVLLLLPFAAILSVGSQKVPNTEKFAVDLNRPLRKVEIKLGKSVHEIKGLDWPRNESGQLSPHGGVPEPHEIIIHLPSGVSFRHWSKSVLLSQENGIVSDVVIDPLCDFVRFHEAVAKATQVASTVRFQRPLDLFERLKQWSKLRHPPAVSVAGKGILEDRITLFIQLKPNETSQGITWWPLLTFEYWPNEQTWKQYNKP